MPDGGILRHVPPGKGRPAPEPPNAWDTAVVEGPHRHKIAEMLDELTAIAEYDWIIRHLTQRRNALFVALAKLNVTRGRMQRAYAIEGKTLITHVGIKNVLDRAGIPANPRPTKEEE